MHRILARFLFVLLCATLATALGVGSAMLYTPAGRALLLRLVSDQADNLVRGTVSIGGVTGSWFRGVTLQRLTIKDTSGVLFAEIPEVTVSYRLADILAGRIVIASASLDRPNIQIIKYRDGRLNYQDIFHLGETPAATPSTPPQLIEIRNLSITGGTLTIRLPWTPDGRLTTLPQVDSALAFERAKPGRRIEAGPEGLDIVRTIEGLEASMSVVRVSSPDDGPVFVNIQRLAARLSDPAVDIRDLRAEVQTKNDSLLFDVERIELPGSEMRGAGRLDWPRDTILYHFNLTAPRLSLADLRWVSPGFPDYRGSASVIAQSVSGTRTQYDIRNLALGDSTSRVTGRLVALSDIYRGLGFRHLDLQLGNVDLDVARPYLDSIPLYGKLTGRLAADGFFESMAVSLDWRFQDARVPGGAESRLGLDGTLRLGGADGMFFEGARLSNTDTDLRTIRLVVPAMILEGRLGLNGVLTGPWKNVVFDGTATHQDGTLPQSLLRGRVRMDTRSDVLGLEADAMLDSLSFEGIRRAFPTLHAQGKLGGRVQLVGHLDDLAVDTDIGGAIGRFRARGRATVQPPHWAADSLRVIFSKVNLAALDPAQPETDLQGTVDVSGNVDSAVAPTGRLALVLGKSRIRTFPLDSATALVSAADSLITVDTVHAEVAGATAEGSGSIGWARPKTGRFTMRASVKDLAPFDSVARALAGMPVDSAPGDVRLTGSARGTLRVEGALGALKIDGTVATDTVRWLAYRARNLRAHVAMGTADSALDATVSADSLLVKNLMFTRVKATTLGQSNNFAWTVAFAGRDSSFLGATGRLERRPDVTVLHADSLNLDLLGRRWGLSGVLDARIRDSIVTLDTVRLVTRDGSGSVELKGDISRGAASDLSITVLGVQLRDVYGLMQHDTTGISGSVLLDARLSGTAKAPEIRGTGSLTGGVFGDFQAPLIRTAFDYRNQLLQSNLTFWRTGAPVVEIDAKLPLDLSLTKVAKRQLPGPLTIIATGDSVDLAIAEAFTPNFRRVSGSLNMDVRIEGSWDAPRLAGQMQVIGGMVTVPALGVRYGPISGAFRFTGDSIRADSVRVAGKTGDLLITGGVRLERLTQPILGLTLSAHEFDLIDVPDYLRIQTWGDVNLTGTLAQPELRGAGRLTKSVIYFADLISKDIVNLEDPMNADLVDTLAIRTQNLGANFQSRFLDSLAIRDLDFIIGDDVWLRSNEANFQLEGRLRVNKSRQVYRIDGSLNTPRGTYTLTIGPLIRSFSVERGSVRYFGDLNAELDVQARNVVKTVQGPIAEVPVIAHITGTLQVPKLALSSPPDRPPLPEQELISYLIFGTPDPATAAQFGDRGQSAYALGALALNAFTNELQRALISGSGSFDIVEIRPGVATSGVIGGATSATQVAIGSSITNKLFIIANAGFCFTNNQNAFSAKNLGASLEYRFRRELRMVVSAEPLQTCVPLGADALSSARRYQFGAELRWDRDY